MNKNLKYILVIALLFTLLILTACNNGKRTKEQEIAYQNAVEHARITYIDICKTAIEETAKTYGLDSYVSLNERDENYFNRLFSYLVYTHEIRELQLEDKKSNNKAINKLEEKQTEAMKSISLYIKSSEIIDIRFDILDEFGTFNEDVFAKRLSAMLFQSILGDSFNPIYNKKDLVLPLEEMEEYFYSLLDFDFFKE